ncbi:MAG: hypothetical protein O7G87_00010 [bacterium]|nr:hypothetical protein [bacterium]
MTIDGKYQDQIERSLQREDREGKQALFPIRIDNDIFDWKHQRKADLLERVVGDLMIQNPGSC